MRLFSPLNNSLASPLLLPCFSPPTNPSLSLPRHTLSTPIARSSKWANKRPDGAPWPLVWPRRAPPKCARVCVSLSLSLSLCLSVYMCAWPEVDVWPAKVCGFWLSSSGGVSLVVSSVHSLGEPVGCLASCCLVLARSSRRTWRAW